MEWSVTGANNARAIHEAWSRCCEHESKTMVNVNHEDVSSENISVRESKGWCDKVAIWIMQCRAGSRTSEAGSLRRENVVASDWLPDYSQVGRTERTHLGQARKASYHEVRTPARPLSGCMMRIQTALGRPTAQRPTIRRIRLAQRTRPTPRLQKRRVHPVLGQMLIRKLHKELPVGCHVDSACFDICASSTRHATTCPKRQPRGRSRQYDGIERSHQTRRGEPAQERPSQRCGGQKTRRTEA